MHCIFRGPGTVSNWCWNMYKVHTWQSGPEKLSQNSSSFSTLFKSLSVFPLASNNLNRLILSKGSPPPPVSEMGFTGKERFTQEENRRATYSASLSRSILAPDKNCKNWKCKMTFSVRNSLSHSELLYSKFVFGKKTD